MKIYMFRTVRLSIIRSLFTVHSAMVYVIQVCRQLSSRTALQKLLNSYLVIPLKTNFINKYLGLGHK
jgi:hypothetical protein